VRQRTSCKTTKAELELAVDVGEHKGEVLNWMTTINKYETNEYANEVAKGSKRYA